MKEKIEKWYLSGMRAGVVVLVLFLAGGCLTMRNMETLFNDTDMDLLVSGVESKAAKLDSMEQETINLRTQQMRLFLQETENRLASGKISEAEARRNLFRAYEYLRTQRTGVEQDREFWLRSRNSRKVFGLSVPKK
jgi:hypothetical protein